MTYDVQLTSLIGILLVSCIGYVKSTFPNPCYKVFHMTSYKSKQYNMQRTVNQANKTNKPTKDSQ